MWIAGNSLKTISCSDCSVPLRLEHHVPNVLTLVDRKSVLVTRTLVFTVSYFLVVPETVQYTIQVSDERRRGGRDGQRWPDDPGSRQFPHDDFCTAVTARHADRLAVGLKASEPVRFLIEKHVGQETLSRLVEWSDLVSYYYYFVYLNEENISKIGSNPDFQNYNYRN